MNTKSITRILTTLMLLASVVISGCGDDPVAPQMNEETPPVEIKTPTKMRINSLLLWSVPGRKSNGDTWDWDPFTPSNNDPDIYHTLGNYKTETLDNYAGTSQPRIQWEGSKGYAQMNYAGSYSLKLYDKDDGVLQGNDDHMVTVTITPSSLYRKDNATRFTIKFVNGAYTVWAYGEWIY